jgi:hypothetical protein
MSPELYHPVLDCFLRALPHLYRDIDAPVGTVILVEISGDCGGQWFLSKQLDRWGFAEQTPTAFNSRVTIPQELAWRLFTKGLDPDLARAKVAIEGDQILGAKILNLTTIVG